MWVLAQIKSETSLEAKMAKWKLSSFQAHQRKAGFLGKSANAGKMEGSRKRGRLYMRWMHSIKEAMGMRVQEPSRGLEHRTLWTPFILRISRSES